VNIKTVFYKTIVSFIFLSILLAACGSSDMSGSNNRVYGIDKSFRDFYKKMGGVEVLGPVISEVFFWEENQCQYTENTLMCFNQNLSQNQGYFFFPVGAMLGGNTSLNGNTSNTALEVYEGFMPLYQKLGGEPITGRLITPVRYNLQEKRIEQYFENIGFYCQMSDSDEKIQLLAYGAYTCNEKCKFTARQGAGVNVNANTVSMPFLSFIKRFEHLDAFGEPLTAPIEIQPGLIQQVYQNAVFIGNPALPETIHLLDVPVRLGVKQDQPGPQLYNLDDNMVFYVVNSPNGFHVPSVFDQFIIQHGGRELSGSPLCEVYEDGDHIRQCFQNYCLDFLPGSQEVKMVPLGEEFLQTMNIQTEQVVHFEYTAQTVTILIQEKSSHVPLNEEQELQIQVLRTENRTPLQNIAAKLKITLPDGNEYFYDVPATDQYGISKIAIPAIKRVQNGSVLTYSLCLNVPGDEPLCVKDSYLVW
jgi:hypothetical protein